MLEMLLIRTHMLLCLHLTWKLPSVSSVAGFRDTKIHASGPLSSSNSLSNGKHTPGCTNDRQMRCEGAALSGGVRRAVQSGWLWSQEETPVENSRKRVAQLSSLSLSKNAVDFNLNSGSVSVHLLRAGY